MADEQNKFCFRLSEIALDQPIENKKRTFSGVAYSGEVITDHWYWKQVIFDLDSMQIKGRIPALLEHSSYQRAGAIESHSISYETGLTVSGILLSNEFGAQVASDSDDGFPWQMSVRIEPSSVEDIQADASVSVNGKIHQGPITVFRGGRIREVSFCALGADSNTNAVAASHSPRNFNQPEDTDVDLEQANAKIKELETKNSELEAENKQFAADKREAEIKTLEAELKKEFSAEDKTKFSALDDTSFGFMASQLRQFSVPVEQKTPGVNPAFEHLFKHQATGGQGDQQPSGNQHQFTAGAQAFADQNKGA